MPEQGFLYKGVDAKGKPLKPIAYKDLDLNLPWEALILRTNSQPRAYRNLWLMIRAT